MTNQEQDLLDRLRAVLEFVHNQPGARPCAVIRSKLPKELRITQAELLEALGAKRKTDLPQKFRHAVGVTSRIHTGRDCFRSLGAATARLYNELEERFERDPLEKGIRRLGGEPEASASIAELRHMINTLRESRVEDALQLKRVFDILSEELGRGALELRLHEMSDGRLMESRMRLRFSVGEAATEILQSRKRRVQDRLRRFNQERNRHHYHETFTVWCKKYYGREDARREARLSNALVFAEAFKQDKVA